VGGDKAHYVGILQALSPLLLKRTLIFIFSHFSPFTILLLRYKTQHVFPEPKKKKLKQHRGDFSGPVAKTSCFQCRFDSLRYGCEIGPQRRLSS
jgi:hypothetical protein